MDSKFNLEDMVPFVALEKLKYEIDLSTATPQEILRKYSEIVWDFEAAYTDQLEHGGYQWEGN